MLALIGFDAASVPLLDELCADGRMPRLAELRASGTQVSLETPGGTFPAATFPTLWTGVPLARHGVHYPFMWDSANQRVRYVTEFPHPPGLWEPLAGAGGRSLVVDAYEASRPASVSGLWINGWQFGNRVVLRECSVPAAARKEWVRRLGRPPRAEEVFGAPDERRLRHLAEGLTAGPRRVAEIVLAALDEVRPDLVVVTFCSLHIAGHQFWAPEAVLPEASVATSASLRRALEATYVESDLALGRIVDALPSGSDVIVHSVLGMAAETSRNDVLSALLGAVLGGRQLSSGEADASWRMRAGIPASLRARIASALPDSVVTSLAARVEHRGMDWSRTRAFVVPSDAGGYIRLNIRGRERDGIVDPADAVAVAEELKAGLLSFSLDGVEAAVVAVDDVQDVVEPGPGVAALPDLIVRWPDTPARQGEVLASPRFGSIRRDGFGSGRSGNHTDDAWALIVPGSGRAARSAGPHAIVDIAATALERFGLEAAGTSLLESS